MTTFAAVLLSKRNRMKRNDLLFALVALAVFLPFFVSNDLYQAYVSFNSAHGMVMSFVKFAILATMGELLGLRISTGAYYFKGFGIAAHALVWGLFGMWINLAFVVFSAGVPALAQSLGVADAAGIMAGPLSWPKVALAFAISVVMNTSFGPVFMTLHKVTDAHILAHGGSLRCLVRPIRMGEIIPNLNWKVQWNFVFKKTIPLFWFPAHTATFLLPGEQRILCAALLSVLLGVFLSLAARKK